MNSNKIADRAFLTGLILGGVASYIPKIHNALNFVTRIFYKGSISSWAFAGIWGAIFGGILVGSYTIYLNEGWWGLVRTALILTFFVIAFWIAISSGYISF